MSGFCARASVALVALLLAAFAVPERAEAGGIKDAADSAICGLVGSDAGARAGRKIILKLSGNRIRANGAVMSVAIWSAQNFCPDAVPRVTTALTAAFGSQRAPTAAPTASDMAVIVRRIRADAVAADLRAVGIDATRARVQRSAGSLCRSLRQGADAAALGRGLAGESRVPALAALSGVVGLMKNCASPPAAWQTDALSAALATTLVANTYASDLEPPTVALTVLRTNLASDGRIEVTLEWSARDSLTGVVSEPWLFYRGRWQKLPFNLRRPDAVRVWIDRGEAYAFAVRATDRNGNTSAFAYSATFRA